MAAVSTTLCDMGLLDDAIREHLDLKRRRGADPTEVERSEREALGPVRRTPERVPGDDFDRDRDDGPEAGAEPEAIYDDGLVNADEPGGAAFAPGEPDLFEPVAPHLDEPGGSAHPGELAPPSPPRRSGPDSEEDEPSWSYDDSAAEAQSSPRSEKGAVPAPHRAGSTRLDDDAAHTAEYDAGSALGSEHHAEPPLTDLEAEKTHDRGEHAAPPAEDEDMLEETPEFLQDTPDHDRLWFEQRPPKDFDFNG